MAAVVKVPSDFVSRERSCTLNCRSSSVYGNPWISLATIVIFSLLKEALAVLFLLTVVKEGMDIRLEASSSSLPTEITLLLVEEVGFTTKLLLCICAAVDVMAREV